MENTQLHKLKAVLKKCQGIEADMAADKNHLTAFAEERMVLEVEAKLMDRKALGRLAQLQAVANLAPRRAEAQMTLLEGERQELVAAAHEFIRTQLRPRCLKLREAVGERLRQSLQAHYQDEDELLAAVNGSGPMAILEKIETLATIGGSRTEGCQPKAMKLIQAWSEVNEFERAHLN